jgi:hypothetical protein
MDTTTLGTHICQLQIPLSLRVQLLKYLAGIPRENPIALDMLDEFSRNFPNCPLHLTAYFLTAHFDLEIDKSKSSLIKFTFLVKPVSSLNLIHFCPIRAKTFYDNKVLWSKLNLFLNIRMRAPNSNAYETGEVIWYNPFSTEMSVRWPSGGYTVRRNDITYELMEHAI